MAKKLWIKIASCSFALILGSISSLSNIKADVIVMPTNAYWRSNSAKCQGVGREFTIISDDEVETYVSPDRTTKVSETYRNGDKVTVWYTYETKQGETWGLIRDRTESWIPMSEVKLNYDHQEFCKEYANAICSYTNEKKHFPDSNGIIFWEYPNSGIVKSKMDGASIQDPEYRYVYVDSAGRTWAYVGYFCIRSGWVCFNDPYNQNLYKARNTKAKVSPLPKVTKSAIVTTKPTETPSPSVYTPTPVTPTPSLICNSPSPSVYTPTPVTPIPTLICNSPSPSLDTPESTVPVTTPPPTYICISNLPTPVTSSPKSDVSVSYKTVSDWGSNMQGEITIKNTSDKTYNGWNLAFDYENEITSLWVSELVSQTDGKVLIKSADWEPALEPGQSVTVNFIAINGADKSEPINFVLKEAK